MALFLGGFVIVKLGFVLGLGFDLSFNDDVCTLQPCIILCGHGSDSVGVFSGKIVEFCGPI